MGWLPVQLPLLPVRVLPSFVVPLIPGATVFFGAWPVAWTTFVGRETATPLPDAFVAVTWTRTRLPTSVLVSVYCREVAPEMALQFPPDASQRCHWKSYDLGLPVQLPCDAVKTEPSRAEPLIDGSDVLDGTAWRAAPMPMVISSAMAAAPARAASRLLVRM